MFTRDTISVGKLILNTRNFRIVAQDSQKAARDAIIAEQGKKLVVLAKDIIDIGLSPFDLPMVIDVEDGNGNFVMMEGNRRLTAIQLLLDPELAKGTPIHRAFLKLHKDHTDAIPKVIDCAIAPNREAAIMWGNRKHASGLGGAGTDPWTAMAKARADKEQGSPTPVLDVVNFVLENKELDPEVRHNLEGSGFSITTLERLITTKELQKEAGLSIARGRVRSSKNKAWTQKVLSDVVTIIAAGKKDGKKWTEREVDTVDKRKAFAEEISAAHPRARKAAKLWIVSGSKRIEKRRKKKSTPSTHEQKNLIPKGFDITTLPAGKVNDLFIELKKLNVNSYRHAVSIVFRVFFEITLNEYIQRKFIKLPAGKDGNPANSLKFRLDHVFKHVKDAGLLTKNEIKAVNVAMGGHNSWLSPNTMNAFVHSPQMNPDPQQLKAMWANIQPLIVKLWEKN